MEHLSSPPQNIFKDIQMLCLSHFLPSVLLYMPPRSSVTLSFSWFSEIQSPPGTCTSQLCCTAFPAFKAQLHCFELLLLLSCSHSLTHSFFFLSLFVSVNQLVSLSVTRSLSTSVPLFHTCTHIHIAQVPLGKLLSLPMNSAMLLPSLDPKRNIMNNEQQSRAEEEG